MNITYRNSTDLDADKIDQLLKACFGDRIKYGVITNLTNRYLLAFDDDVLIAMTGLIDESPEFNGSEIDWTCILPQYRGRGIIVNMIKSLIQNCNKTIYCSCWRHRGAPLPNLYFSMQSLGFQCVRKEYKTYNARYQKMCNHCIHKLSNDCFCCEDLYIRKNQDSF